MFELRPDTSARLSKEILAKENGLEQSYSAIILLMQVTVTVKPGSSQEKIVENEPCAVTIWTHARAHDGEANQAVIKMLSDYYHVSKTSISLFRGANSRKKIFNILDRK